MYHNQIVTKIRRQFLVEDGLELFSSIINNYVDPQSVIKIVFIDKFGRTEEGSDAGGLFKEFIQEMVNQICNPDYGFFQEINDQREMYLSSKLDNFQDNKD